MDEDVRTLTRGIGPILFTPTTSRSTRTAHLRPDGIGVIHFVCISVQFSWVAEQTGHNVRVGFPFFGAYMHDDGLRGASREKVLKILITV